MENAVVTRRSDVDEDIHVGNQDETTGRHTLKRLELKWSDMRNAANSNSHQETMMTCKQKEDETKTLQIICR